jgi:hypothetical protein
MRIDTIESMGLINMMTAPLVASAAKNNTTDPIPGSELGFE